MYLIVIPATKKIKKIKRINGKLIIAVYSDL